MKLTTKGRYGLRLMLDLAQHKDCGAILLKDIAERQNLSEKYLWSLIAPLKAAGFVHSIRGAKGGYMLARQPEEISLKSIITTLEGTLCMVDCVSNESYCNRQDICVSHKVWRDISDKMSAIFENYTLASILDDYACQNNLTGDTTKL